MKSKQKILKFIGYSGSGKTTLIEKVVRKLSVEGLKIATIKHDVHGLDIDKEGKDSYRYSKAGAKISVVSSPELTIYKIHKPISLTDIISNIDDVDMIIIEGYSNDFNCPTICVARKETKKGIKGDLNKLSAIISDYSDIELNDMGYSGVSININEVDAVIKYIKGQL